jgi:hypothetical protein
MGIETWLQFEAFGHCSVFPHMSWDLMFVKACSDWKLYITLLKCSNWRRTSSLDVSIRERHHVTSWLSPVWDPELRMWMGCVLHSPPDKGAVGLCLTWGT